MGLVLAGLQPFRRIIGVEMSPELSGIARDNIERARDKLICREFEVVTTDASRYEVPTDVSVVFLWNPFVGQVLARVIEQIRRSLEAAPRPMTVVYALPEGEEDVMTRCSWLSDPQPVQEDFWTGIEVFVYQAT